MKHSYDFAESDDINRRIDVSLKDETKPVSKDNLHMEYYALHGDTWHQHTGVGFSQGKRKQAEEQFMELYEPK